MHFAHGELLPLHGHLLVNHLLPHISDLFVPIDQVLLQLIPLVKEKFLILVFLSEHGFFLLKLCFCNMNTSFKVFCPVCVF